MAALALLLAPLLLMAVAYTAFYVWILMIRMRREIIAGRVRALRLRQAEA